MLMPHALLEQMFGDQLSRVKGHVTRANNGYTTMLASHVEAAITAALNVSKLNAKKDPTQQPAAHVHKVGTASKQVNAENIVRYNKAAAEYRAGKADIEQRLNAKLGLARDWRANEVLLTYRSKGNEADRFSYILELIEAKDASALAALFEAGLAVDLKADKVKDFKDKYAAAHAPELVQELKAHEDAYSDGMETLKTVSITVDSFCDPMQLAELDRQVSEAKQAEAALVSVPL